MSKATQLRKGRHAPPVYPADSPADHCRRCMAGYDRANCRTCRFWRASEFELAARNATGALW